VVMRDGIVLSDRVVSQRSAVEVELEKAARSISEEGQEIGPH